MKQTPQESGSREKEVFIDALDKATPDMRAAFLDGACGKDTALRQRVEAMLADHFADDRFLADPAIDAARTVLHHKPLTEGPGTVIDRYKLLQQIGEGGMGIVYMAEQQQPVIRKVALKIIKLGMDTKQVIARFEAERQALALMDHPNIARVLDGGATESGRPYFVMELVQGVPITEFCDMNHLTAQERLNLFIPVCQAIQSAHQKGIIHRDIKPSNVLVTLHHGDPMPKVIDFGVAKATNQKLTEKTLFTHYATMIGTPAYMSPEQAEMTSLDIDTRTDVYALGVLLYELLTGTTPFPEKRLRSVGYGEMQRIIAEEEPEKPSTRLSTMANEQKTVVAQNRGMNSADLGKLFRSDLDWIVVKCLEKDRRRRYDTPNELVADLKRHLDNKPISAAAPSLSYQLNKLYRRHRPAFIGAAAVLSALFMGLVIASWQAVRARNAEQAARRAEQAERFQNAQARVERDRAVQAEADARAKALLADTHRQNAETNETNYRRLFYAANMNLAQQAWERTDLGALRDALEQTKNEPERGFEWFYWQNFARLDARTIQYSDQVTSVAFSPDSQRMVIGSEDGTTKVWAVATGRHLLSLTGHADRVTSLAYSPNGQKIVSASDDSTARLWDAATGKELLNLKGHTRKIETAAFFPDGQRIATGGADTTVRIWDANTGQEVLTLPWPDCYIVSLAISPDGKWMVIGGWPQNAQYRGAKIVDAVTGRGIRTLEGHVNGSSQVAISPNGLRIATGGRDGTARVWDAETGKELFPLAGHNAAVDSIGYSPDGRWILTSRNDQTAKVWDAESGREVRTLKGHASMVLAAGFSPDNHWIVTGSFDRTAKLWEHPGRPEPPLIFPHTNSISSTAISADGRRIVSAGSTTPMVWETITGRQLFALHGHTEYVGTVAISADGQRIVTGSADHTAKVWDTASGKELHTLRGHSNFVLSTVISADGRIAVTGSEDQTARVWDAIRGIELSILRGHNDRIMNVAISTNSQRIVTASERMIKVWDAVSGRELRSLQGLDRNIASMALSPDGRRIVTSIWYRPAKVWDTESGKELFTLKGHVGAAWAIAFTPDARRILLSNRLFDAVTGRELLTLKGHTAAISTAAFSADGQRLVMGGRDQTVRVWEAATPQQVAAWREEEKIEIGMK